MKIQMIGRAKAAKNRKKKMSAIQMTLINELAAMRDVEYAERQTFKVRAYNVILTQLERYEGPLESMADVDAANFTGLGKGIRGKMEQIFASGKIAQLEEKRAIAAVLSELATVHGIGPVKATELMNEHGITTVAQLAEHQELLNATQLKGLRYHADMQKRIPNKEMWKHHELLKATIKVPFEIAGSFRRGAATSGDIDVILCTNDASVQKTTIDQLKNAGYIVETLADGPHKFMGVSKLPRHRTFRRIDIMWMEPAKYAFALLYFTGSKDFNVRVRNAALFKGYTMNEYGIESLAIKSTKGKNKTTTATTAATSTIPPLLTEREILEFLGMDYVEPVNRK